VIAERDRAYGRELCCGIAEAARREGLWSLSFVGADALKGLKALNGFDGVIARVVDDTMAARKNPPAVRVKPGEVARITND